MIYAENIGREVIKHHACCAFWAVPISRLAVRERSFFDEFAPGAAAALVVGHHVTTKQEWTWFQNPDGSERSAAEDHAGKVCMELKQACEAADFKTWIVPYPDTSGLQFRFVAQAAGAGRIGMNAFLLHPVWGPWIHLRILATEAETAPGSISPVQVCTSCGSCMAGCPAGAIKRQSFDGLACRSYRKARGEYVPFGPQKEFAYCTICADACPVGDKPQTADKITDGKW